MSLSRNIAKLLSTEHTTFSDVIAVLTKYKMLSLLPSIKQSLVQMSSRVDTEDTIMIETPFLLSDDAVKKVKRIIGNDTAGHEVIINKSILAGFKARFRGTLYDGSAERIIKQLMNSL